MGKVNPKPVPIIIQCLQKARFLGSEPWQFIKKEDTATGRVFLARLVSTEHVTGLWIEPATSTGKNDVMYVPWSVILAIRSESEEARRQLDSDS